MNLRGAFWHQFSLRFDTFSPAVCPPEKLTGSHSGLSWPSIWKRLKRKHLPSQPQRVSPKRVADWALEDDQAPKIFTWVKTMLKWLNQIFEVQQLRANFLSPTNFPGHHQIEKLAKLLRERLDARAISSEQQTVDTYKAVGSEQRRLPPVLQEASRTSALYRLEKCALCKSANLSRKFDEMMTYSFASNLNLNSMHFCLRLNSNLRLWQEHFT